MRLADGSVGKVYRVGGHYEADILFKGRKAGTLDTRRTVLRHHGVTYSFHPYTGSLWAEKTKGGEGGKKGDKDKKDKAREQRTVVLDDGSRAVISRLPDGSYTARIHLPDGSLIGTLGKGRTVAEHNGFVYTFHPYTGQIWGEAKKEPRQDTGQENGTEGAGAQPDEGTPTPEQPGPADPVVPD
ncbi:hypothetical protein DN402_01235 [Streptomyces sp. SW4]|nr:hypothetical protein DN402_01235 [Streptomyces sp. SW4]